MFDDLRNTDSLYYEDDEDSEIPLYDPEEDYDDEDTAEEIVLFGLNSFQRFVIALLILMMTCVLGSFCLILTQKVVLPFI